MSHRRLQPRRSRLVVSLLAAIAVLGCSSDDAPDDAGRDSSSTSSTPETAGEPRQVTDDDELYAAPDPIPSGDHGQLLRYQPIESGVDGADAYRLMYLSESVAGEPIVVTGTAFVPTATAPPRGRPVLAIAHGTTGIADECAPSREGGGNERFLAPAAIERGWIVTITDYEGLGTPGRHPYLVGESEGRSVIDSVLAASGLPDANRSDSTLIAGYSQGGHGALWADQVAGTWAPELDVVGTFAGAPATELPLIMSVAADPGIVAFAFLVIAGFEAAYPEADPALVLTDEGLDRLDAVDSGCIGDVFGAVTGAGDLIRPSGPTTPPWPELVAANDPGRAATEGPVLIVHSDEDDLIPVALSAALFDRMCELGQHAERRVLENGGGHGPAAVAAFQHALAWFDQLLAGENVPDTCP